MTVADGGTAVKRLVLDTSVLIDHLRGRTTSLKHFPMFKGLKAPY